MSIKFLAPNTSSSADMWYADWLVVSPLINFLETFEMRDGTPGQPIPKKAGSKFLIDLEAFSNTSLADRDPRLAKTVFIEKYIINGSEYTGGNAKPTGAGLYKFLSPNLPPPFGYNTKSQQDWVIMRYADVLLMLAEAENELNGPTELVYKSINTIRKRLFYNDSINWIERRIPALDNLMPIECLASEELTNRLREVLLRTPL